MIYRKPLVVLLTRKTPTPTSVEMGSPLPRVQLGRCVIIWGSFVVSWWPEIVIPHIICEDATTLAFNITDKFRLVREAGSSSDNWVLLLLLLLSSLLLLLLLLFSSIKTNECPLEFIGRLCSSVVVVWFTKDTWKAQKTYWIWARTEMEINGNRFRCWIQGVKLICWLRSERLD